MMAMNLRCPNEGCRRFLAKEFQPVPGAQVEVRCACGWIVRVTVPAKALDKVLVRV